MEGSALGRSRGMLRNMFSPEGVKALSEGKVTQQSVREIELGPRKAKKYARTWRRSRPEMVRDILRCLPEKITRIAYGANLSWLSVLRLLRFCEDRALVLCENGVWYLTKRGREYIEAYGVIETIVGT